MVCFTAGVSPVFKYEAFYGATNNTCFVLAINQRSIALFFDSAISDISQYRIGLGWEVSYRIDSAIVPGENVKYRIYRIIGAGRKIRIAAVGLSGFAGRTAFALQPCTRLLKPWVTDGVARLGSLSHTLRLPHHGMHCLEPSSRLVHCTDLLHVSVNFSSHSLPLTVLSPPRPM